MDIEMLGALSGIGANVHSDVEAVGSFFFSQLRGQLVEYGPEIIALFDREIEDRFDMPPGQGMAMPFNDRGNVIHADRERRFDQGLSFFGLAAKAAATPWLTVAGALATKDPAHPRITVGVSFVARNYVDIGVRNALSRGCADVDSDVQAGGSVLSVEPFADLLEAVPEGITLKG